MNETPGASLASRLRPPARCPGGLSFPEFMRAALYDPEEGYYVRRRSHPAGPRGDFLTAPEMTPAFGNLVASFLRRNLPPPVSMADWGAGCGLLSAQIAKSLPEGFFREIVLVEKHPAAEQAAESLRRAGFPARIAAEFGGFSRPAACTLHLANEFLDAFPVEAARRGPSGWERMFVTWKNDAFAEDWRPMDDTFCLRYLERYAEEYVREEGQRVEIPLGWEKWFDALTSSGAPCMALAFDYGGRPAELYAPVRRGGTLRCFFRHTLDTRPLENPGEKDITASVNFSFAEDLARERGLEVRTVDLAAFLIQAGAEELLQEGVLSDSERRGLVSVMDPSSMGGTFKACVMTRGLSLPELRTFRDLAFAARP
jgi:SAM-dependent MidA family methyltransferase